MSLFNVSGATPRCADTISRNKHYCDGWQRHCKAARTPMGTLLSEQGREARNVCPKTCGICSPAFAAPPILINSERAAPFITLQRSWLSELGCLDFAQSQWREDVILLPLLQRIAATTATSSTFVELGAIDGRTYSNTYLLERCFSWSGILIEPQSRSFARLEQSGRTRSSFVHAAASCEREGSTVRIAIGASDKALNGTGSTGGQVGVVSDAYKARFITGKAGGERGGGSEQPAATQQNVLYEEVPCESLRGILSRHGQAKGATFLSLDVEGAEELVLRAGRAASLFAAVLVETDQTNPARELRVRQLLESDGGLQLYARLRLGGRRGASGQHGACHFGGCSDLYVRPALLCKGPQNLMHCSSFDQFY